MGHLISQEPPTDIETTTRVHTITTHDFIVRETCNRLDALHIASEVQTPLSQRATEQRGGYSLYIPSEWETRRATPNDHKLRTLLKNEATIQDDEILNADFEEADTFEPKDAITREWMNTVCGANPGQTSANKAIINPAFKTIRQGINGNKVNLSISPDALIYDEKTGEFIPVIRLSYLSKQSRARVGGYIAWSLKKNFYPVNTVLVESKSSHGEAVVERFKLDEPAPGSDLTLEEVVAVELSHMIKARKGEESARAVFTSLCKDCAFARTCNPEGETMVGILPSVNGSAADILALADITTVQQAAVMEPRLARKAAKQRVSKQSNENRSVRRLTFWRRVQTLAEAFLKPVIYRKRDVERFEMPQTKHLFTLDVETDSKTKFTYQIGLDYHDRDVDYPGEDEFGVGKNYTSFLASGHMHDDERIMFYQALDHIDHVTEGDFESFTLAYHSPKDIVTLNKLAEQYLRLNEGDIETVRLVIGLTSHANQEAVRALANGFITDPMKVPRDQAAAIQELRQLAQSSTSLRVRSAAAKISRIYNYPLITRCSTLQKTIDTLPLARKHLLSPFGHSMKDYMNLFGYEYSVTYTEDGITRKKNLDHSVAYSNWKRYIKYGDTQAYRILQRYNYLDCRGVYELMRLIASDTIPFTDEPSEENQRKVAMIAPHVDRVLRRKYETILG
jgi:hypothetical protein